MSGPYRPLTSSIGRLLLSSSLDFAFFFFLAVAVAEPAALVLDEVAETTLEGPAETAGRESAKVAL